MPNWPSSPSYKRSRPSNTRYPAPMARILPRRCGSRVLTPRCLHYTLRLTPYHSQKHSILFFHQVWLDRRTNYTRSLAVMSMVGYMLGLGDRHFSNIMLDRYSGKITHIDFGDCFEVSYAKMCFLSYPIERLLCKGNRILRRFLSGLQGCSSTRWK